MSTVCTLDPAVDEAFRKFKLSRSTTNRAFIMKVDPKRLMVVLDQELDDVSLEQLQDELPSAVPRYIAYSYRYVHKDDRVSFPLVMIYYSPPQIKPELAMMYSSSLQQLYTHLQIQKVFDVRKPSEMTEEWLRSKLAFFG